MRVIGFIDGFNLYHAIDDLGQAHLKWVDLPKVCEIFCPPPALVRTEGKRVAVASSLGNLFYSVDILPRCRQ